MHTPNVRELLGYQLSRWRVEKKLSLKKMALDLGVSESTVSLWEHGRRFPSSENLDCLARYMDKSVCHLVRQRTAPCAVAEDTGGVLTICKDKALLRRARRV
jgi:transcriptional regulator with XRE-family HTH domain